MNEPSLLPRLVGDEGTKVFYHYAVTLRFQLILHPRDHLVQILLWNKKQSIQPLLLDLAVFEKKFDGVIGERVEVNVTKTKALKANFGTSKDLENVRNDVISGLLVEFVQEHLQIEGDVDNKHHELKVILPDNYLYTEPILLLKPEEKLHKTVVGSQTCISDWSATLRALDNDWAQENLPTTLRSSFSFAPYDPIQERRDIIKKVFQRVYRKVILMNRADKLEIYIQRRSMPGRRLRKQPPSSRELHRPFDIVPPTLPGIRRIETIEHSLNSLSSHDSSDGFISSKSGSLQSSSSTPNKKGDTTTPKLPHVGGPFVAGSKRPTSIKATSLSNVLDQPQPSQGSLPSRMILSASSNDLTIHESPRIRVFGQSDKGQEFPLSGRKHRSANITEAYRIARINSPLSSHSDHSDEFPRGITTTPSPLYNYTNTIEMDISVHSLTSSGSILSFDLPSVDDQEEDMGIQLFAARERPLLSPLLSSTSNKISDRSSPVSIQVRGASSEKTTRSKSPMFPLPAITENLPSAYLLKALYNGTLSPTN